MSSDDAIYPEAVNDFVFDLHDVSRRSFIPSEQQQLYMSAFREITAKVSEKFWRERPWKLKGSFHLIMSFVFMHSSLTSPIRRLINKPTTTMIISI